MTKNSQTSLPATIVHQWFPEWESVPWSDEQRQAKPKDEHFYLFSMRAAVLKRLSGIQRRSTAEGIARTADTGIQRFHDAERSAEIGQYVRYGYPWSDLSATKRATEEFADLQKPGWLPTAIIVNVAAPGTVRRDVKLHVGDALEIKDSGDSRTATVALPLGAESVAWKPRGLPPIEVIDGQHRLWAFSDDDDDFELPVVAFRSLDVSWQAYLFWSINIKPKRISASLAFDLYPLLRSETWLDRFSGHPIYRETRAQELVEVLWSHPKSPWYRRINMLGETQSQMQDRRSMVSQSAWVRSLTATFVRNASKGGRPGGLFGGDATSGADSLGWSRVQQAAFLLLSWQKMRDAVQKTKAPWASAIREECADSPSEDDAAFFSRYSLFTTDPGIRAFLAVTNSMVALLRSELNLSGWSVDSTERIDQQGVDNALASLKGSKMERLLSNLTTALATYDWRTSTGPGLDESEKRRKKALRGSGGYRELRKDLFLHLANSEGRLKEAAMQLESSKDESVE